MVGELIFLIFPLDLIGFNLRYWRMDVNFTAMMTE